MNHDATLSGQLHAAREQWNNLQKKADELRFEVERASTRLSAALMRLYTRQHPVSPSRMATLQEELGAAQRRWMVAQEAANNALSAVDEIAQQLETP